jgi:hypothetical protein
MGSIMEGNQTQTSGFYGEGQGVSGSNGGGAGLKQASTEQAKRIGGLTRQKAFSQVDAKKGALCQSLNGFAQQLESLSGQGSGQVQVPQQLIGSAVGFVRKASDTLENRSTEELLREAKTRMQERPAVALAGFALLGFVAARFLKA